MNKPFPVVRLEVEGMRHTVMAAMTEYQAQIDADIRTAIDEHCSSENIQRVIKKTVQIEIDRAIENEISSYFGYSGPGRKFIKEAVIKRIDSEFEK